MANSNKSPQDLTSTIYQYMPKEAEITRIEYEGPRISIHTKNYQFLSENSQIISDIVNSVKRRLVIRIDRSMRKSEKEVKEILYDKLPTEIKITNIYFDDALGEVIVEVKEPFILNNNELNLNELSASIGWKILIKKGSDLPSSSIKIINYVRNSESDKRITKGTGWLEILGCGMVDPEVFNNVDYDSSKYSGYAFGVGIERIAMLLYGIEDIREFYKGDTRFLEQFK